MPAATSSQTIGPFWHLIEHPEWADLTRFGAEGERVVLTGTVFDGDGNPVIDAAVELWQADPPAGDRFPAFGRSRTDEAGRFHFTTLKPGPVPGRGNAQQAPHFAITILARGLLKGGVPPRGRARPPSAGLSFDPKNIAPLEVYAGISPCYSGGPSGPIRTPGPQ